MTAYGIFADESSYSEGRYRTIAAVSAPANRVPRIQQDLQSVLDDHDVVDAKWSDIRAPKTVACANSFVDCLFRFVSNDNLRTDIIIWDTEDARHNVPDRDDIQNYERMFFHLHRCSMQKRESSAIWHIRPDEQLQIDWATIHSCLASSGTWTNGHTQRRLPSAFYEVLPRVKSFKQVSSKITPLCQLADLLAGIARYTRWRSDRVMYQLRTNANQASLFNDRPSINLSARDKVRFKIVEHLYSGCVRHGLGVSLETNGYFVTHDPKRPINFWHYRPQHAYDHAPVRGT